MSGDLVAFIEARLAEDELWAKAASSPRSYRGEPPAPGGVHWVWGVGPNWEHYQIDPLEEFIGESVSDAGGDGHPTLVTVEEWPSSVGSLPHSVISYAEEVRTADGAHIARHDPARILRDVEALRAVAEECKSTMEWVQELRRQGEPAEAYASHVGSLLGVLKTFAAVWRNHPDYRQEWTP